jgi:hypothetical protein
MTVITWAEAALTTNSSVMYYATILTKEELATAVADYKPSLIDVRCGPKRMRCC